MKNGIYNHMILGTAYYPEHWDKILWEDDILRMKEHGINMVRIGDFAWCKLEPEEGNYNISYYDSFLELCEKHSMKVIFCTPTAAPPMWLLHGYPEILNCDMEGNAYYGPRRHYNYNSPVYREFCKRLVTRLAEHYGKRDIIAGWQIDNELNCDLNEFYSEADHTAFRRYLKNKFETLERLNESMGLTFWSREYSQWDQVTLNRKCVGGAVNPHLALEEKRFISESAISFCAMQTEIIRKYLPDGKFITTNGLFENLDYNRLMECGLDFITFDSYPNFAYDVNRPSDMEGDLKDRKWSWNLQWTRSVSPVFGIMEQQSGANGWTTRMETPMPKPGQMKLWTMQSIGHGADMVSFFRWRTSPIGCEIYWHGLNDYSNRDNRRLRELKEISRDVERIKGVKGSEYRAQAAILKDYSNVWDGSVDCWHKRVDDCSDNSWFAGTQLTHTPCDFLYLRPETGLEELMKYKLLVYPHPAVMDSHTSELLRAYVTEGGTLILGARTGYKDEFGRCPMRPMPGLVSQWCGVTVEDYTLIGDGDDCYVDWGGEEIMAPVFHEVLRVNEEETKVVARFRGNYYEGQPALCLKELGRGRVYYLGACFSVEMAEKLLEVTGLDNPYGGVMEIPETVELAVRANEKENFLFLLNYKEEPAEIMVKIPLTELLSAKECSGNVTLKGYEAAVFCLPVENR
ncbi:MAG: beta-galactosidase [Lacrimispora sp.]